MIRLFLVFFKVGIFGYGGGLAMLPLIFQSVQDFGFMTAHEISDLVALSQVTPGAIAVNAATFVGIHYAGIPGALLATLGVILPAFVIMQLAMNIMDKYWGSLAVQGSLVGMQAVVIGLIAAAIVFVAETTFTFQLKTDNMILACITVLTVVLVGKVRVSPIWIAIIMGTAGAFLLH